MQSRNLPVWLQPFSGKDLQASMSEAAILASVDDEGWPHHAYLGAGEILARPTGISIALWKCSRTTANIMRDGRAVLYAAAEANIWEARLMLTRRLVEGEGLAVFDGVLSAVRRHAAPYANVLGLLEFKLHDKQATLDRWRKQIELLRGY